MSSSSGINLLAKIILEKEYYTFGKLKPAWFVDFEHEIYSFVTNFVKQYNKFPTIQTFKEELSIEDITLDEPLKYYFDQVIERYKKNILSEYLPKINKEIGKGNTDGIVSKFEEIVEDIKENTILAKENFYSYKDMLELALNTSVDNRYGELLGITTGWNTLDGATMGFTNGNFYAVVARVKMGKSLILSRMSRFAYHSGKSVLFVSLEMPAIEIANRFLGLEYNINKTLITKGRLSSFVEQGIKEQLEQMEETTKFWFIDGKFSKTIDDLAFTARQLQPDIIYIDGAYLLRTVKQFKAKWELVTYTAEQLKYLAMDLNIPIVASYQFNRQVSRKSTSVKDTGFESIGLSDAISQLASIGIALIAPEGTDEMRRVEVIGARDGGETSFDIKWDWDTMDFSEVNYG